MILGELIKEVLSPYGWNLIGWLFGRENRRVTIIVFDSPN